MVLIIGVIFLELTKAKQQIYQKCQFEQEKWNNVKYDDFLSYMKMNKKIITFGDNEIEKRKFLCRKNPVLLKDVVD